MSDGLVICTITVGAHITTGFLNHADNLRQICCYVNGCFKKNAQ